MGVVLAMQQIPALVNLDSKAHNVRHKLHLQFQLVLVSQQMIQRSAVVTDLAHPTITVLALQNSKVRNVKLQCLLNVLMFLQTIQMCVQETVIALLRIYALVSLDLRAKNANLR